MTKISWEMTLDDPMQCFGKQVENIRSRLDAKNKDYCIVKCVIPVESEERPVTRADWYVVKCLLEIELSKERATPKGADELNGTLE
jgi:hypothetical protein